MAPFIKVKGGQSLEDWSGQLGIVTQKTREEVDGGGVKAIDDEGLIVDTLKPASYEGSKESRYGRRGHIPTAVNVPYTSLLDEAGCFLPEPELRRAFAGVGDGPVLAY